MVDPEKLRRFPAPAACDEGQTVTLAAEASHHMTVVLRAEAGDRVRLFTGDGREFIGRVESTDPEGARVHVEEELPVDTTSVASVTLGFAPPPAHRSDVLIEKAVELGVTNLQPFLCERSQGHRARKVAGRLDRWERKARDAARQCGRTVVPGIAEPVPFDGFVREAPPGLRIIADTSSSGPLWRMLEEQPEAPEGVILAVGPAGGFTRRERELAVNEGFVPASLGPTTLRVETAAICLLTGVMLWLDGWGGKEG
ncbi:MAG: RsmE family RNA methyltransferase [Candidatus Brocadiia bacterium]